MAAAVSGVKRPLPDDDNESSQKRSRSNNGSPAPTASATNGKAALSQAILDARARAAEVAARLAKARGGQSNGAPANPSPAKGADSVADRVAEMKARVAAAKERASAVARAPKPAVPAQPQRHEDTSFKTRGGLDVGLHPALLADSGMDSRSGNARLNMQPKFATTMANKKSDSGYGQKKTKKENQLDLSGPSLEEIKSNPYFDPSLDPRASLARGRTTRKLNFNEQGKYIAQASALRKQAALEVMKKKIADAARKAGMDENIETERAFLIEQPPAIEWWDENLINGQDYSALDKANGIKIEGADTVITSYIQHPVAIEPPQEKIMPPPKAMYLTPKEQKKLRRQNRKEALKEQQMKQRLGLEPAPAPKVKKSNLMRVLGQEAVLDPTAVEARVTKEIEARAKKHEETNAERALTKEEKHEKLAQQQEADAAKGIKCCVWKIDTLANGKHRFQISKNAEQQALTGICILHPKMNLVIVEGGQHSINSYKKLMTNRIKWAENSWPKESTEGNRQALASWMEHADEKGNLKDLGTNQCVMVWEGELGRRAFKRWGHKVCETDKDAKDALKGARMESFWVQARSMGGAAA